MDPGLAAIPAAVVLAALGLLHVAWGVTGVPRRSRVLPEVDGRPLFRPTRASCFGVAAALFVASYVLLVRAGQLPFFGPPWLGVVAAAAVGVVLVMRAVGDFRYVGFFKRERDSAFARLDSRYFSPLCLLLGALALWAAFGPSR